MKKSVTKQEALEVIYALLGDYVDDFDVDGILEDAWHYDGNGMYSLSLDVEDEDGNVDHHELNELIKTHLK